MRITTKEATSQVAKVATSVRTSTELRQTADLFKRVSDPTRLYVLLALEDGERNATGLFVNTGAISRPSVSHHLMLLSRGRLIASRRQGHFVYYNLTKAGQSIVNVIDQLAG